MAPVPLKAVVRQLFVAFLASWSSFACGEAFIWGTPMVEHVKTDVTNPKIGRTTAFRLLPVNFIGVALGALPAGLLLNKTGKKPLIIFVGLFLCAAWAFAIATTEVSWLFAVRIMQGMAEGIMLVALSVFLGEIASPEIRGTIVYFLRGMFYAGEAFTYFVVTRYTYNQIAYFSMAVPVLSVFFFFWVPMSPYSLIQAGKEDKALEALAYYRGVSKDQVSGLFGEMCKEIQDDRDNGVDAREFCNHGNARKALFYVLLLQSTTSFCGGLPFYILAPNVLFDNEVSKNQLGLIAAFSSSILCAGAGVFVDKVGRKIAIVVSLFGSGLCMLLISIYYYFLVMDPLEVQDIPEMPVVLYVLHAILIGIGIEAVTPVYEVELFKTLVRGPAIGICRCFGSFWNVVFILTFNSIGGGQGLFMLFLGFIVSSFLGCYVLYFLLPETKGQTFAEVQEDLVRHEHH